MNFSQLCVLVDDLSQKMEGYRGATSNADSAQYLDWAMKVFAQSCNFYDPSVTFTPVLNTPTYQLNNLAAFGKKIIEPLGVVINGNPLYDARGSRAGLWSMKELSDFYPKWRTDSASVPTVAVSYGSNSLLIYPKPTQAVIDGGSNYVEALIVPGWIKTDTTYSATGAAGLNNAGTWDTTATPDLSDEYHEALGVMAAIKACKPMADSDQAWAILNAYSSELGVQLEELGRKNRSAISAFGSIRPSDRRDHFVRLSGGSYRRGY